MGLFDRLKGNKDKGPRVAFFGIDGVPYTLISENSEVFPNLTEIIASGSSGSIKSIVPPESSACWPSLTTGVNPGKTGVYGFQDREIDSYETYVPMGRHVKATRIWDIVEDNGRNATVMNVPVTFPPQTDIQRMVSGFLSPSVEKASHPSELTSFLESIDYRIDVDAKLGHKDDKTEFIEDAHNTIDARRKAFKHYIEKDDWDLFFGVFMTTDRVNHFLFKDYEKDGRYKQEFLDFYKKVDRYLGELKQKLSDDVTMMVASDHGFTSLNYEVNFNRWLQENDWLSYKNQESDSLEDISDETMAYSLIPGRFYLNLEGREPRGKIPNEQYKEKRSKLKSQLQQIKGPDGNKVCNRIIEKENAFHGDYDTIAPDLVAIPNNGFDLKSGFKQKQKIFTQGPRNGMHTFDNATLIIDNKKQAITNDTDLYDITPKILDLMDIDYNKRELDTKTKH